MTKYLLLLFCVVGLVIPGWSQPVSKNLSLSKRIPYNTGVTDIWGWEDGNGNEYAIVGLQNGVSIVDVTVPGSATEVANLPGVQSGWRDMKTFRNYAYVSNESDDGIRIIDMSTLPGPVAYKDTALGGLTTSHNLWIDERGFLYVAGSNVISGLMIFDLNANPEIPQFVGSYGDRYVHDVYVRNGIAYLAEINSGFLTILDVTNPAAWTKLGQKTYPGAFTHNTWLNDAGTVCFTTDEYSGATVRAWDITDPANIRELDGFESSLSNGGAAPHNVHVLNDFLVTSYYKDGVNVVDATYPDYLVETGYYDTSPANGGGFDGAWGAYPFLTSGTLLVSDMSQGLFVLKPSYTRAAFVDATVLDESTGNPIAAADIEFVNEMALTNADGNYFYGQADSGTYQMIVSAFGYLPDTVDITLLNGVTAMEIIELKPRQVLSFTVEVRSAVDSSAIRDANIELVQISGPYAISFRSDANGQLIQTVEIGPYTLTVGKWGYKSQQIIVNAQSGSPTAIIYLEEGYKDDFILDLGWSVIEGDDGKWERGEPIGSALFGIDLTPDDDLANDLGTSCYVTGLPTLSEVPKDEQTVLVSPPINLKTFTQPKFRFNYWFVNDILLQPGNGQGKFKVEITNGLVTFPVLEITDTLTNSWTLVDSVSLTPFLTMNGSVFLKFTVEGSPVTTAAHVDAALDGFELFEAFQPDTTTNTAIDLMTQVNEFNLYAEDQQLQLQYDVRGEAIGSQVIFHDLNGRYLGETMLDTNLGVIRMPFVQAEGIYVATLRNKKGQRVLSQKFIMR
ncbi:MAG: choice-of-anchor B family protein [Bacteroidota bacterium]